MAQHLNPDNDCGRRKMCREFPWLLKSWWSFKLPKRRCCIVKACLLRISFYCRILWSLTGPVWACQIDLMVVGVILFQITYWIALKIFFNFMPEVPVTSSSLHLRNIETPQFIINITFPQNRVQTICWVTYCWRSCVTFHCQMFYRQPSASSTASLCVVLIVASLHFSLVMVPHHDAIVTMDTTLAAGHLTTKGQGLL